MCGITGIIDFSQQLSLDKRKREVHQMNQAIFHRGPDGAGEFHNEYASLAMRRLAIIDLAGGDQPLWNEDRTIGVIMNGEIYNYASLKKSLQAEGHRFYSDSDVEVLVHLYETKSDDFVKDLRGMFAFCLVDLRQERILLARDRFGEKPLYYHLENGLLSFASEAGPLLQSMLLKRTLDKTALRYYLAVGYVPEPLTLVKGLMSLPAAGMMVVSKTETRISSYFVPDYSKTNEPLIKDRAEAQTLIEPVLRKAVRRQLMSDVPLGAFLSGGIDSSTVCALAQEELDRPLDTFTVRFEEASYDESKIAAAVAEHIGSNHHEIVVPNTEFSESIFWKIIDHVGLPFPDSSAIPVYLISQEIRKHVKVALSGDGGDELFGGYVDLGWWQKVAPLTSWPLALRQQSLRALKLLPTNIGGTKRRQLIRGLRASLWGKKGLSFGIHRMQFEEEVQALISTSGAVNSSQKIKTPERDFSYPLQTNAPAEFKKWSPLRQAMYYRLNHKLPTDMLVKVDRMSMANSLETRAPFLDPDLFAASLRLDDNLLFHQGTGKRILRDVMKSKLPAEVFNHPKQGFSIPLHKYQNAAYWKLSQYLLGPGGPLDPLLNLSVVRKIEQRVFAGDFATSQTTPGRASHQHWQLMLLAGWLDKYRIETN